MQRRVGRQIWVSKIGMQFWPYITKGEYHTIQSISRLPNGKEVVAFADGSILRMDELGSMWVAFDRKPDNDSQPYLAADTLQELRDIVSADRHKKQKCLGAGQ